MWSQPEPAVRVKGGALRALRHRFFMMPRARPLAVISAAVAGTSALIALRQRVQRSRGTAVAVPAAQPRVGEDKANVEYLRHMYAMTRSWYTAAETKAQLLLAVNGLFVTVLFGILFGNSGDHHLGAAKIRHWTWALISFSVAALVIAIICAALCLWSLHGRAKAEFDGFEVDPEDPDSFPPEVLWYFGHVAHLERDAAKERLRSVGRRFEIETLSYHVVDLAHKVLRKHRYVNAGWAFTALALIALVGSGVSFFA
jgi:Pycsar effector protein